MSVLFNEYLIDKKLLNCEQVIEILLEQLHSIPSVAELIYECNFLAKEDLLKILFHQQSEGKDFYASASALGLWDSELANKLMEKLIGLSTPFSELLIKKGFLSLDELSKEMISFAEIQNNRAISEKPKDIPLQAINSSILKEYLDCFEESIHPNMKKILLKLKNENLSNDEYINEIKNMKAEFIALQAAANFVGAKQSENTALSVLAYFDKIISKSISLDIGKLVEMIELSIGVLEGYFNSLKLENIENKSEINLMNLCNKFFEKLKEFT